MIKKNTVFILGAGASKPFGYPTGWELRDEIIKKFLSYFQHLFVFDKCIPNDLRSNYVDLAPKFIEDLKRSNPDSSIDLFLSRNKQYAEIGKIAITLIIMHSEITGTFRNNSFNSGQDWYSYLFSKMSETLPGPNDYKKLKDNKINFITFNYDRSFEHLLYDRFIHDFTNIQDPENSAPTLMPFAIIHVYGVLSKLPWQEKCGYEYKRVPNPQEKNTLNKILFDFNMIQSMAKNIRIIQERTNTPEIEEAKKLIETSDRVFFLGFGFARENLEILGFPNNLRSEQEIYGTALGMTDKEIDELKKFIYENARYNKPTMPEEINAQMEKIKIEKMDCRQLLREYL
jgi:hypothetical protein